MRRENERIVYRTDFDKYVLISNFERLGWTRSTDEDFDIYWASVHNVRGLFNPEVLSKRLRDGQVVNHFPNHYELTRKDLMARNIKRYRRERERQEQAEESLSSFASFAARKKGQSEPNLSMPQVDRVPPEWVPATYSLPNDYAIFVEEFRKSPNSTWIAKPTGKAQGRGIFLVSKLNQLKRWSNAPKEKNQQGQPLPFREPYIISRYISNPLLVGGKKFDMRLYVLVTSYRPLKVFLYRGGFCRFCVEQYSTDVAEIDNIFVHLTNVAIQKQAEDYNEQHGGKWAISDLMLFIESTRGRAASEKLASDMEQIIVHTLKAVQGIIVNDKHCFEMYGFDVLIDKDLRPWLLEVNASPSMTTTTEDDRLLKLRLINDVLNIAIQEKRGQLEGCDDDLILGDFACIFDEKPKVNLGTRSGEDPRSERNERSSSRGPRRSNSFSRTGYWR
ncbi:unnamed protein product [Durusdinium trenchii]|uniref:ATP-grasp domain-containing protein n=2 Tax=Durusdinium trenchii TaxID=1381693 RepID=A0ABP0PG01_9DINO